ncbi:MAG TPA: class II fructose-bisphosphatase [Chthoniobacterales bacterium]|jgi:fructose-1,6-bisphosphatase II|nr:class II fructose-bisphosphatase [Chthoniobacterales bacterium]
MRIPKQNYDDIERIIEFDFVRATEAAALNALPWLGRGDKEKADGAACDAIRGMFDLMNICGEVVIGEGIKDEAPGIFKGEQLGMWLPGAPQFDIALDPIDGTTNIAKGAPNSITCIAAASPEEGVKVALRDIPSFYMMKLAYGPDVIRSMKIAGIETLKLESPIEETLITVAKALQKRVQDVVVMMLDRPRHKQIMAEIRSAGASLRMISDGDIAAAMAPSYPESGIDLYVGIGGAPEAVLAAAGIKCLGGDMQCAMWPRDDQERADLIAGGYEKDLGRVFFADDLAMGKNIIFCATGISDSALLRGVKSQGPHAITHSVLMRAKSKTVRFIRAAHNLGEKTIRLRSDNREHRI